MLFDEVLAVGDASFQQRCLDHLRATLAAGTTLVFVSHDVAAVEATYTRGVLLHDGTVWADGPVHEVLDAYRKTVEELARAETAATGAYQAVKVETRSPLGGAIRSDEPLEVTVVLNSEHRRSAVACLGLSEGTATPVILLRRDLHLVVGQTELRCSLERLPLPRGRYSVWFGAFDGNGHDLHPWRPIAVIDVVGPDFDPTPSGVVRLAPVHVDASWQVGPR